jgi:organic radical activating enzyme
LPEIDITTSVSCKIWCKYCPQAAFVKSYYKNNKDAPRMMSMGVFKTCIDKIPLDWVVNFSGFCEPFQNDQCIKMISYASQQGRFVNIYTTLRGFTEKDLAIISCLENYNLLIHLPSKLQEMKFTPSPEYLKIFKAIYNDDKIKKRFVIHEDDEFIPEIAQVLDHGYKYVLHPLHDRGGSLDNLPSHDYRPGKIVCPRIGNGGNLFPDGRVVFCCQDWELKHILGNLLDQRFEEVYEGSEAKKIERALTNESIDLLCRHCRATESF